MRVLFRVGQLKFSLELVVGDNSSAEGLGKLSRDMR